MIKKPLHIIFDLALRTMKYPTKWKTSFVTPIFKSGDNTNIENYRPISILSAISKIFDKLIFAHIHKTVKHMLTSEQHGFTAGKSTLTNLLEFTTYITNNMMGGGQVDTVFMDKWIQYLFDKIDHSILLRKLSRMPLDPCLIKLIQSYLNDRCQIVCVGGIKSQPITPKSSVPQGSVLSPLLFALFINDLPRLIKAKILMFADDVKIFLRINSIIDTRTLQHDIQTIVEWCDQNNLKLNVQKCYIMSFTRRHDITFQHFNYNIGGITLNRVQSIRDLGVTLDRKLNFEAHVKIITKKAYSILGFICRSLNKFKNVNTYKMLYFTYVRSILEYCTPIWNPYYDVHVNDVERVQRRYTRSIYRRFHYPRGKKLYNEECTHGNIIRGGKKRANK